MSKIVMETLYNYIGCIKIFDEFFVELCRYHNKYYGSGIGLMEYCRILEEMHYKDNCDGEVHEICGWLNICYEKEGNIFHYYCKDCELLLG